MTETIQIGELAIAVTRKAVKHVHLSVHPPAGHVTLVAPTATRLEVARAYVISKLGWIRDQQAKLQAQARETPRQFIERESHNLWGRRYLLSVIETDTKPGLKIDHRQITLFVRPGTPQAKREEVMQGWYRSQLHAAVPSLIEKWEARLGVKVSAYFLQRMKTKWGSCNPTSRAIRLNTDLAKKPPECLEYIVVHELAHLIEPSHNARFVSVMNLFMPKWQHYRDELNNLPVRHEDWDY
mgnify:CR=1 FL=1